MACDKFYKLLINAQPKLGFKLRDHLAPGNVILSYANVDPGVRQKRSQKRSTLPWGVSVCGVAGSRGRRVGPRIPHQPCHLKVPLRPRGRGTCSNSDSLQLSPEPQLGSEVAGAMHEPTFHGLRQETRGPSRRPPSPPRKAREHDHHLVSKVY